MSSVSPLCVAALGLLVGACGCARSSLPAAPAAGPAEAAASATPVRGAPRGELAWSELTAATFARAKAERRFVVLDGSAEWCHWCHVMEAETYHDPAVQALLAARFIAVKVDVDTRPDLEERYGDYGWPATVIFSPDGVELGKYRGFIEASKFVAMLTDAVSAPPPSAAEAPSAASAAKPEPAPMSDEHLDWIQHAVEVELDEYWDREQGGWGRMQKSPIGSNNEWKLGKAARGDAEARRQVRFALEQQARLIDPVWGGIYQYSTGGVWTEPHFEKLMTYQAPALDNYARAYQLTGEAAQLARARSLFGYLERFMKSPEGGFYSTQDADLHAHEPGKPFLTGHDYYARGEAERLALGVPRIDRHEYGRDNGLAISAYATFFEVTHEPAALAAAETAARRILDTHWVASGGITHDQRQEAAPHGEVLYLSDNAAFGLALMRLYQVTHKPEYLQRAQAVAELLQAGLRDPVSGGCSRAPRTRRRSACLRSGGCRPRTTCWRCGSWPASPTRRLRRS